LQNGERVKNPVDAFVVFDAADREQSKLGAGENGVDAKEAFGIVECESAHAHDVGFKMEVAEALVAEILASDDGGASAGETVGDDAVANSDSHVIGIGAPGDIAEERRRVVHKGVEAAQAGKTRVQRWLIA